MSFFAKVTVYDRGLEWIAQSGESVQLVLELSQFTV